MAYGQHTSPMGNHAGKDIKEKGSIMDPLPCGMTMGKKG